MVSKSTLVDHAITYATQNNWHVFPCNAWGKYPIHSLIKNWKTEATTNVSTIRQWWSAYPQANIGVHCGKSNLFVLDFDIGKWSFFSKNDTFSYLALRDTRISLTGGGGCHVFYACEKPPRCFYRAVGTSVQIKMKDDWIIVPPSVHPNGAQYRWLNDNCIFVLPEQTRQALAGRYRAFERMALWWLDRLVNLGRDIVYGI